MIPKIIHQIWIGNKKIPKEYKYYMKSWKIYNPEWEYNLWTDDNLPEIKNKKVKEILNSNKYHYSIKSDLLRYYILYEYGGLYVDADFECYRNFDCFLNNTFFAGYESSKIIAAGLLGSLKKEKTLQSIINICYFNLLSNTVEYSNLKADIVTGPKVLTDVFNQLKNKKGYKAYDEWYFYPLNYNNTLKDINGNKPFASHHWWLENNIEHWKNIN
jgi:mannosyltransferase OCH1-like enzyme